MPTDLHQRVVDRNLEMLRTLEERNASPSMEMLHGIVLELLVETLFPDPVAQKMFQHAVDAKLGHALTALLQETPDV